MNGDGLASAYTPGISHPPPEDVALPPASSSGGGSSGGATTITDGTATGAAAVATATIPLLSNTPCLVIRTVSTQGVTVGDNADTTQGAKGDAAATDTTSSWSVIALLKAIFGRLLAVAGNIGGYGTYIKDVTAVTASSIYAAGNAVGAKRTFASALRAPLTGVLNSVTLLDRSNSKAAMTLYIFDDNPTAATITDKAAFVFNADDLKVIAQVNIGAGDYVTNNSKAIAHVSGLGIPLKGVATTLYGVLVTSGTPTFAATSDVQLGLGIFQD